ncbi:unnamed protein product [Sphagnum troendelagicum]|uniref:Uncharacterized protein n=1 Tax=Sphagnum troendelagicum TaxID=128251 RepID=A0ABP0T8M5_9BRYO
MVFSGNENGGEMAEFKSSFVVATTRALRRRRRTGGPPLGWDGIRSEQLGFFVAAGVFVSPSGSVHAWSNE